MPKYKLLLNRTATLSNLSSPSFSPSLLLADGVKYTVIVNTSSPLSPDRNGVPVVPEITLADGWYTTIPTVTDNGGVTIKEEPYDKVDKTPDWSYQSNTDGGFVACVVFPPPPPVPLVRKITLTASGRILRSGIISTIDTIGTTTTTTTTMMTRKMKEDERERRIGETVYVANSASAFVDMWASAVLPTQQRAVNVSWNVATGRGPPLHEYGVYEPRKKDGKLAVPPFMRGAFGEYTLDEFLEDQEMIAEFERDISSTAGIIGEDNGGCEEDNNCGEVEVGNGTEEFVYIDGRSDTIMRDNDVDIGTQDTQDRIYVGGKSDAITEDDVERWNTGLISVRGKGTEYPYQDVF